MELVGAGGAGFAVVVSRADAVDAPANTHATRHRLRDNTRAVVAGGELNEPIPGLALVRGIFDFGDEFTAERGIEHIEADIRQSLSRQQRSSGARASRQ